MLFFLFISSDETRYTVGTARLIVVVGRCKEGLFLGCLVGAAAVRDIREMASAFY